MLTTEQRDAAGKGDRAETAQKENGDSNNQ